MRNSLIKGAAALSAIILSGCASYGNWTPTVDPYGDPNAYRIQQDMVECRQLALHASGGTTQQTVTGGLVGGAVGAAAGAAIGAAVGGSAGTGAAIGAATGGMGGGAHQGLSAEQQYKYAFIRCMKYRGHNVIN